MSYLFQPIAEPITIYFDFNGCWRMFGKLGVVLASVMAGYSTYGALRKFKSREYTFSFDLVVKPDLRLCTKL
jgi:hypothetical protein